MQLPHFSAVVKRGGFGRSFIIVLLAFGLMACSQKQPQYVAEGADSTLTEPQQDVADFHLVSCQYVWSYMGDAALNNPLYWQRAIDCAVRLTPAEARAKAKGQPVDSWQNAFRQAVLLSHGNVTPIERRHFLQRLDSYAQDYPAPVRPLLILWRDGQRALLQLSAERSRYAALEQSTQAERVALREQQTELQKELATTRRKLDRLTDIERQLSARRPADASESNGHDAGAAENSSADEANP
ncbi:two-component system QseEF-associated lipoprotein QseG [Erwinia tasmaniensis]|uniref:Transcriptional regulator of two-component regulator protein n=1 Tax=Erwinia tasmaniensis (strain DSM 17950 / CFBP 7177 / CIP 109463 / NCPPB 4357 / Et1/99) TaxID=465817 RepID=B2VI21_ERWT9|nr:two-component system QseEF-associated lipoprotein QseG [Erwinia tasmaniensis]CAO96055.1 Putative transcriptional regulator of two-component regulator protein [Erwinia tasmaniensis Et1/99]